MGEPSSPGRMVKSRISPVSRGWYREADDEAILTKLREPARNSISEELRMYSAFALVVNSACHSCYLLRCMSGVDAL
jgi:hypothetical protein